MNARSYSLLRWCVSKVALLMFKIYMRELFCVNFCMLLVFSLWVVIRPEEQPRVIPESHTKAYLGM